MDQIEMDETGSPTITAWTGNRRSRGATPEHDALLNRSSVQPVKLTPGWESHHSNSDLLKGAKDTLSDVPTQPPPDRCNLLYIIFAIHGIGVLMPWNMFINADKYFTEYKLNATNTTHDTPQLATYRENLLSYMGLASQLPNVFFAFINLFIQMGDKSIGPRIVICVLIEISMFIVTVVLAMVDSSDWPLLFFYLTMTSVVILNAAGGVYQSSMYGLAGKFPGKFVGAVVLGTNISGTAIALVNIFSIWASPSQRTAAIYYFISALFVLLLCLDTYFALPLLRIYRYYSAQGAPAGSQEKQLDAPMPRRPPYWLILKKAWMQCYNVFMVFFVTLACFPAIVANVEAVSPTFPIQKPYFTAVICFLFFNGFAMLGNIIPMCFKWPGPRYLWLPVTARLVFLPFFIMCNYKPDTRVFPVYINNDYVYAVGMVIFALTSGYYSSLGMMYAPQTVPKQYAAVAGMLSAFFLVLGIFIGSNSTFLTAYLVTTDIYS